MDKVNNKVLRNGEGITDLEHIAYSFVHGGFDPYAPGGCSCDICVFLRKKVQIIRRNEAKEAYEAKYNEYPREQRGRPHPKLVHPEGWKSDGRLV